MKGQWIGPYSGSNSGRILLDIDDCGDFLDGVAYLIDDDQELPTFRAIFRTRGHGVKFKTALGSSDFYPVDRVTGNILSTVDVARLYPNVVIPSSTSIEIEWDTKNLNLEWATNIGTWGHCSIIQNDPQRPSNFKSKVGSWKSFKAKVAGRPLRRHVFRGQNVVARLRTSFHRNGRVNLLRFLNVDIPAVHKHLSARTKHYFNLSNPDENGAFLSLIQHHGYPTPLLDWTYSPFVSAFFAYRGISSEEAKKNPKNKVRILMFDKEEWQRDMRSLDHLSVAFPHFSLMEFVSINNERMIPQQGISSVTNLDDIESYIGFCEKTTGKKYLQVFDLPWRERDAVVADLSAMGITAGSLFPGLDGACEEMKERMF